MGYGVRKTVLAIVDGDGSSTIASTSFRAGARRRQPTRLGLSNVVRDWRQEHVNDGHDADYQAALRERDAALEAMRTADPGHVEEARMRYVDALQRCRQLAPGEAADENA